LVRMVTRKTNPAAPRMIPLPLITRSIKFGIGSVRCMCVWFTRIYQKRALLSTVECDYIWHVFHSSFDFPCICKGSRVSSRLWANLQLEESKNDYKICKRMHGPWGFV
jgi:hypothetical protein